MWGELLKGRIAIIDSGIGGLTIFNQYIQRFTGITYLADNKYFPYGTKTDSELINIIDRIIYYFLHHDYELVILACNTASLIYEKYLKYKYHAQVISIIDSTINDLYGITPLNQVGIIATNQVVSRNIYTDLILKKFTTKTTNLPASELVTLCEENDQSGILLYIKSHFHIFKDPKIDALILGCTHFNIIQQAISDYFNGEIPIICSGYSLIKHFQDSNLCLNCNQNKIYLTDYQASYAKKIKKLFKDLKNIEIQSLKI